jgi:hypothetical protein
MYVYSYKQDILTRICLDHVNICAQRQRASALPKLHEVFRS